MYCSPVIKLSDRTENALPEFSNDLYQPVLSASVAKDMSSALSAKPVPEPPEDVQLEFVSTVQNPVASDILGFKKAYMAVSAIVFAATAELANCHLLAVALK